MTALTVSVIVPSRDRPVLLREALASIAAVCGTDLPYEVLVCDNGTDPGTPAVADEFGARWLPVETPGAGAARNVGLAAAKGDYIAFLDDDDAWTAAHLRPHLAFLCANPDFDAVVGQVATASMDLSSHAPFLPEAMPSDGDLFATFLRSFPQIGATVARTRVRETVGFFDETLLGDQDWDWHLRLAREHLVGFVAVPSVLFRQRPPGDRDDLQWARLGFTRRVFLSNVRRAGLRRSGGISALPTFLAHNGAFCSYFLNAARRARGRGDRGATCTMLLRAAGSSPLHFGWALHEPAALHSLWFALSGL
jgi:glycosyltransferase involved in cell wall biosynthesis